MSVNICVVTNKTKLNDQVNFKSLFLIGGGMESPKTMIMCVKSYSLMEKSLQRTKNK